MSLAHPRPWFVWYETTVKARRRDGKRGTVNVEYWGVVDARGVFIAEGLDEDTAREIADVEELSKTRPKNAADFGQFGNAAAMREALKELQSRLVASVYDGSIDAHAALEVVEKALSAPPRNCDVGTADEQAQRFYIFCESNSSGIRGMCSPICLCIDCCDNCRCLCKWAQMPYNEEGEGK